MANDKEIPIVSVTRGSYADLGRNLLSSANESGSELPEYFCKYEVYPIKGSYDLESHTFKLRIKPENGNRNRGAIVIEQPISQIPDFMVEKLNSLETASIVKKIIGSGSDIESKLENAILLENAFYTKASEGKGKDHKIALDDLDSLFVNFCDDPITKIEVALGDVSGQVLKAIVNEDWVHYDAAPVLDFSLPEGIEIGEDLEDIKERLGKSDLPRAIDFWKIKRYTDMLNEFAGREISESIIEVDGMQVKESSSSFWHNADVVVDRICNNLMSGAPVEIEASALAKLSEIYALNKKTDHFCKLVMAYSSNPKEVLSVLRRKWGL